MIGAELHHCEAEFGPPGRLTYLPALDPTAIDVPGGAKVESYLTVESIPAFDYDPERDGDCFVCAYADGLRTGRIDPPGVVLVAQPVAAASSPSLKAMLRRVAQVAGLARDVVPTTGGGTHPAAPAVAPTAAPVRPPEPLPSEPKQAEPVEPSLFGHAEAVHPIVASNPPSSAVLGRPDGPGVLVEPTVPISTLTPATPVEPVLPSAPVATTKPAETAEKPAKQPTKPKKPKPDKPPDRGQGSLF